MNDLLMLDECGNTLLDVPKRSKLTLFLVISFIIMNIIQSFSNFYCCVSQTFTETSENPNFGCGRI